VPDPHPPPTPDGPKATAPAARERHWEDDGPRETVVAVFGDTTRAGAWLPPERLNVVAGFGKVRLDFRRADLVPGPTEVRAVAVFGDVEILVDRDLEVDVNGVALFGKIRHASERDRKLRARGRRLLDRVLAPPAPPPAPAPPAPAADEDDDASWLVVQGWALFGNVKVTIVEP